MLTREKNLLIAEWACQFVPFGQGMAAKAIQPSSAGLQAPWNS